MHRRWRCNLRQVTLTLTCALTFIGHCSSQDLGSLFAGLLGAAEVPLNDTSGLENQIPCPGECVHALTSILCSRVVEQFNCGAGFLRCCVSSDFNFGTVVETSAPLPEETSTETSTEYEVFLISATPNGGSTIKPIHETVPSPSSIITYQPNDTYHLSPTPKPSKFHAQPNITKSKPCPGICVENIFVRYCGNTIPGWCETGSTCCASHHNNDNEFPPDASTLPTPTLKTVDYEKETIKQDPPEVSTEPVKVTAPLCPGSCVAALFSFLCDSVVDGFHCPNEGRCCISTEESEPETTTTTQSYPQLQSPCPGACIPVFLRGMCNRPSEVIIQSDCDRDFVCCYQPDVKDNLHINSPQIPLLRPDSPPQGYPNSLHGPQGNRSPLRQPNPPNPYNQRPQSPNPSNPAPHPVLVPHLHNQPSHEAHEYNNHGFSSHHNQPSGSHSQVHNNRPLHPPVSNQPSGSDSFIHNNYPGYPPMHEKPISSDPHLQNNHPLYPPSHNSPSASDQSNPNNRPRYPPVPQSHPQVIPHAQNLPSVYDDEENNHSGYMPAPPIQPQHEVGFGMNPPSPNNFPYYPNDPHNLPSRPQSYNSSSESHPIGPPIAHDADQTDHQFYDRRKQNTTPLEFPQTFVRPHEQPQSGGNYGIPIRIHPPIIQNPKPVMQPEEFAIRRKQNNDPNRFENAPTRFESDRVRPTIIDLNNNPPNLEKFHPIITQDQPIPESSESNNDDSKTAIHIPLNVQLMEKIPEHSVEHSSESAGNSFIPVHDSFRPIESQQNPSIFNHVPHQSSVPNQIPPKPLLSNQIPPKPFVPNQAPNKPLIPNQVPPKPLLPNQAPPKPLIPNQTPPKAPPSVVPDVDIHNPIPINNFSVSNNEPSVINNDKKDSRPECPGSCIGSFLRFTCFGSSVIYDGFGCETEGTLCCTPVEHVQKYEEHLKFGKPLVLPKPEDDKKIEDTSVPRRPGMYVCGIKGNQRRKSGRVMGGKSSIPGEWCWQVALINAKNQYLCGGALIGSRWVLTAAHCITALVRNGDAIYVRVGDYDLASQYGTPGAQTQKVSTSYIHHNHNGQTLDNDIALLRLENPVQLQDSVCLACLPARNAESPPGTRCTVTGYGYMKEDGPVALKIREAVLPIVEEKICTEQINKVTEKRFILPTGSFCAGGENGNDACQGDGGGPLTCVNEGYHELTGLVSWGFGCGKKDVPGVYVKVSSYIGWVNQIISVNN